MRALAVPIALALALAFSARTAGADEASGGVAVSGDEPAALLGEPLVLERNAVTGAVAVETSLSTRRYGEPTSVAPDVWVGATDKLTVGVIHSARAHGVLAAGFGLCFTGEAHECPRAYDNVGLDARYHLRGGALAAAARVRLVAGSFDPFKLSVRAGGLVRARRGRFAAIADPQVQLGLSNREAGNRDWIRLPLWLAAEPILGRWVVALRTGVEGEVATFDETYAIPIGLDTTVRLTPRYDVSLLAAFPQLLGPLNQYRTRVVWLAVSARWP